MKTIAEAAQTLGVSERRARQLAENGTLKAKKTGGIWLVDDVSLAKRAALGPLKSGRPRKGASPYEHEFTWMNRTHALAQVIYDDRSHTFVTVGPLEDVARAPLGLADERGAIPPAVFDAWWRHRGIPEGRAGIDRILQEAGVSLSEELAVKSLGLSLSDQYWICPKDSGLRWKDVNFFTNDFGEFKPNTHRPESLMHPDNTSEGELPKHWIVENDNRILLKGSGPTGQEPFNEVVATALYRRMMNPPLFVPYTLGAWHDRPVCRCKVFVADDEEYIPAVYVAAISDRPAHRSEYQHYIDCCQKLGIADIEVFLSRMIVCDDLLANTDRHWRNFGLIRNVDTLRYRIAPIFDSGTSLWCAKTLTDLKRGDFSFPSKQFYANATRQFQLADLTWVNPSDLDGFLDEAMDILEPGTNFAERLPFIREGLAQRLERLTMICKYL